MNHCTMVLFYSQCIDTGHRLLGGDRLGFSDRAQRDPAQLLINSSCRLLGSQFLPGCQSKKVQSKPATLLPQLAFGVPSLLHVGGGGGGKKKPGPNNRAHTHTLHHQAAGQKKKKNQFTCVNFDRGGTAAVVAAPSPTPAFMYSSRSVLSLTPPY